MSNEMKPNPQWYEDSKDRWIRKANDSYDEALVKHDAGLVRHDAAMARWEASITGAKTLNGYQRWTNTTALFLPAIDKALAGEDARLAALLLYLSNTINEEAGEIAGKTKRLVRDHGGKMNDEVAEDMALELGDLIYYISQYAQAIGYDLQEVVDMNVTKLEARKERGQIKGSGDKR